MIATEPIGATQMTENFWGPMGESDFRTLAVRTRAGLAECRELIAAIDKVAVVAQANARICAEYIEQKRAAYNARMSSLCGPAPAIVEPQQPKAEAPKAEQKETS